MSKKKCVCFDELYDSLKWKWKWKFKINHKNKTIDLDVDIDTNIQNITCPGKIMSICNKQYLSNIWGSSHYKTLSKTEVELKKCVAYKKSVY